MNNCKRSKSILSDHDPHQQLAAYVKSNNIDGIEKLLKNNSGLLSKVYADATPSQLTILELACFEDSVKPHTIKTLIALGADPTRTFDKYSNRSALHFATLGQNSKILEVIASNPNVDINATSNGRTALHLLINNSNPTKKMMECVKVLWDNRIDLHIPDNNYNTALYFAAKEKHLEIVKFILSKNKIVTTEEAEVLEKLEQNLDYYIDDKARTLLDGQSYLRNDNEQEFIKWYDTHADFDEDTLEKSFLQTAVERHLLSVVKLLIARNPNRVGRDKKHPLIIAVEKGYYRIVECLAEVESIIVPTKVLNEALKRADWKGNGKTEDYQRSCKLILDIPGLNVNECDKGNYPLHYAVNYAGKENVAKLLQNKASLANRDKFNVLTISGIDYDTLKNHFDSCLEEAHRGDRWNKSIEDVYYTFDYTSLFPTISTPNIAHRMVGNTCDIESENLLQRNRAVVKETDVVEHMTKDEELKPLLQHPLIESFLYVKWQQVRFLFIVNLVAYLLFSASLLWFILSNYNELETVPVDFPYVLLFITTLMITVLEFFRMALMAKTCYQSFKEILSCNQQYHINIEGCTELALFLFLLVDAYFMLLFNTTDVDRRPMFAFAILIAVLKLLFMLGSIPKMSVYIVMLRTVSFNVVWFLVINSILLFAFAFAFYTLFRKTLIVHEGTATTPPQITTPQGAKEMETKNPEFFSNIFLALFKTFVMITGEFETGNLDFDQFPIGSYPMFIMFELLMAITLMNLLIGLAVRDTQKIKNDAKLVALTARAQYVSYVESLVLDNVQSCGNKRSWLEWMRSRICVKQQLANDNSLKVYPNKKGLIEWDNSMANTCTPFCCGAKIDRGTLQRTKRIIKRGKGTDSHI